MHLIYFVAARPYFEKYMGDKVFFTYAEAEKYSQTLPFNTNIYAAIVDQIEKVEREIGGEIYPSTK